jgi:hypothetical protein
MIQPRDAALALATMAALVGGVAVVTIGIAGVVVPTSALDDADPTFALDVAPDAIGGELVVSGDRHGTVTLEAATGTAVSIGALRPDVVLEGDAGRIQFSRDTGDIVRVDVQDLSFYPDDGQCTLTEGAVNEESGLMSALLECADLVDIRGGGTVSIAGVLAAPASAIRGRGDVPPTGGSVDVDGTVITFESAELFLNPDAVQPDPSDRIQAALFSDPTGFEVMSGIFLEVDLEEDRYWLGGVLVGDESSLLSTPCPLDADEIGRIDGETTVIRLTIDCPEVEIPGDRTGSVAGEVVVDVIELFGMEGP